MKKIKLIIALVLCAAMLSSISAYGYVNTYNFEIGDEIGNSVYTNVRTFINGGEIQSYGINNYILVAVEDLADYYFIVESDEEANEYYISRDMEYEAKEIEFTSEAESGKVGAPYIPILFSDTKVYFEGNFIRSFDLSGTMVIYADDLAAFTGADYSWNGETKSLTLNAIPYYYIDPAYDWEFNTGDTYVNEKLTAADKSFAYKFKNKSADDEVSFNLVSHTGDYGAVQDISINGLNISFAVYDGIEMTGEYWEAVNAGVNVENGARVEEDTHERRIELFDVFKVYINDEIAGGELVTIQGSGYTIYSFKLDIPMAIDDIDTVQIEVGQ